MPTIRAAANSTGEAEPPLYYKPGAGIMTGPVNVYYIYYGDWSQRQKDIVTQFTNGLIVSPWWKTTLKYYQQLTPNAEKQFASANIRCGKSANDNYSLGKILKNGDIAAIVQAKLNDGSLPEDLSGIYYVLTAKDVIEGYSDTRSMCDNYCGYHYSFWSDRGNQLFSAFSPVNSF